MNEWASVKNKMHKIKVHLLIIRIADCEELEIVKNWKLSNCEHTGQPQRMHGESATTKPSDEVTIKKIRNN